MNRLLQMKTKLTRLQRSLTYERKSVNLLFLRTAITDFSVIMRDTTDEEYMVMIQCFSSGINQKHTGTGKILRN